MAIKTPYAVVVTETGSTYVFPGTPDQLAQHGAHQGKRFPERPSLYSDAFLKQGGPIVTHGPVVPGQGFRFSYTNRSGSADTSRVVSIDLEYRNEQ